MKVLFVGDSPTISTGFARCTVAACNALHAADHEVTVLGMAYYGDPHTLPYPIYPCIAPLDNARSYGGETRLASMIARVKPDIVVILQDPWNIPPYFAALDEVKSICDRDGIPFDIPPVVGWIAVDSQNQKGEQLSRLSHVMVWTEFARKEFGVGIESYRRDLESAISHAMNAGDSSRVEFLTTELDRINALTFDVVPLGVNTDLFYPRDRGQCRADIGLVDSGISADAFIIGVIGRNQMRKRLELSLCYFAEWLRRDQIDNAYLYLHVAPTGERSADLRQLVKFYGLAGRVIVNTPNVGTGDDDSIMPLIYSSFDVYMTQSQGEGFGLPALEAMACGVPCVLPDHSAFGASGWIDSSIVSMYKVSCSTDVLTAPMSDNPYTLGCLPDKIATINMLRFLYRNERIRRQYSEAGIQLAQTLTWKRTGELFVDSLERFIETFVAGASIETLPDLACPAEVSANG